MNNIKIGSLLRRNHHIYLLTPIFYFIIMTRKGSNVYSTKLARKCRPRRWSHMIRLHIRPPSGSGNGIGWRFYKHTTTFGVGWTLNYMR